MAESGIDNTAIDVESLASSMENKMKGNQLSLSPKSCIFRTPSILARHNPKAYIPNSFSFGPFHHDQKNLKVTEQLKLEYLRGLLSRSDNPEAKLRECLNSIDEVKGEARDCYAGNFVLVTKDFVQMLVIDGCFIIELFRKNVATKRDDDPIFSMSCMLQFLLHDLILLENQIPWFVLELLFEITKAPSETLSLVKLALYFLSNLTFSPPLHPRYFESREIKHILDLLRLSFVLPSDEVKKYERSKQENPEWEPIPFNSATRLKEAGVKFVRVTAKSILDMKYRNGALEIPSLLIHETTETMFRNLISYEQCLPNCSPIFTSYAKIMDNLIDTTNDMEILCKQKIFNNWLSPEDATQFLTRLYNDTCVKEFCYSELYIQLDRHCKQWWPKWRASYVQNYFTKPWAIVAQIYAIMIFILTLWQCLKKD